MLQSCRMLALSAFLIAVLPAQIQPAEQLSYIVKKQYCIRACLSTQTNLIQADFVKNLDKQFQASRKEQGLVRGSSSSLAGKDGQSRAVTGTRASSPDSALAAVGRSLPCNANHQQSLGLDCA